MTKRKQPARPGPKGPPRARKPGLPSVPRILFGVTDSDVVHSAGRIWRLAARLRDLTGWTVGGITHDPAQAAGAEALGLPTRVMKFEAPRQLVFDPVVQGAVEEAIGAIGDLVVPDAGVHLWKLIIPDDFRGQMPLLGAIPQEGIEADLLVLPLGSVYSSSAHGSALQAWLFQAARQAGIPVLGLETCPLGNKQTLSNWDCDHYAVRSEWSRDFLLREGAARPDQVSILRFEEGYLLRSGTDDYAEAFLANEAVIRKVLQAPIERKVIALFHSVASTWEMRRLLGALPRVREPMTLVIHVDSTVSRRGIPEPDLVLRAYRREIGGLRWVTLTEAVGRGLLLSLADVLITPVAGDVSEQARLRGKPAIVCQNLAEEGWDGPRLRWEPDPEAVPDLVNRWLDEGVLDRPRLDQVCARLLPRREEAPHV